MPDTHGWIWPKDPRPGNPPHWPRRWRWLDLLRNRGPDIFVGRLRGDVDAKDTKDKAKPTPTRWSRWELEYTNDNTNTNTNQNDNESDIHPAFRSKPARPPARPRPKRKEHKSPFPWARRRSTERYDFRTKRYCIPDSGTWSRVQYCSASADGADGANAMRETHVIPMRYWDRDGNEYPAGYWHDVVYGGRAGCDRGRCHG